MNIKKCKKKIFILNKVLTSREVRGIIMSTGIYFYSPDDLFRVPHPISGERNIMLLYDLYADLSLKGNIRIKVVDDEGALIESRSFFEIVDFQDVDFSSQFFYCTDKDINEVRTIYAEKDSSGSVWLVIEVLRVESES